MQSNKPIPKPKLPAPQIVEALAQQLKAKYSTGFLSKLETPVSAPAMAEAI